MEIKIGQKLDSDQAMRLAIAEAYKGATRVSPNPLVGCVVLDSNGGFLSKGHHEFYGGPHAEVNALKGLSLEQLQSAHIFVTLEPCAHEGKTPSCAKAIAKLPVSKVTFGLVDPNPLVAGQGAQIIKDAGIQAELFTSQDASLLEELENVCEAFLWNFRHKRPFVAVKVATSLDGQIGLKNGESKWITGPESREYVHYLRACYDAVLVGKGTIQADDPSLNVRHPSIEKQNQVVVLDTDGELLSKFSSLQITKVHASERIFWCVAEQARARVESMLANLELRPQVVFIKTTLLGGLDLDDLLLKLYQFGLRSLFIEGGAQTASQFVAEDKVNRVYIFQAPILIGAGGGLSWTKSVQIPSMQERIRLRSVKTSTFGPDLMWSGRLK